MPVDISPGYTGTMLRVAVPLRGAVVEGAERKLWPLLLGRVTSRATAKSAMANAITMTRHRMVCALIYLASGENVWERLPARIAASEQTVTRGREALDGLLGNGTNTGSAADDLLSSVDRAVRGLR
jgi:transposase-like protein